MTAQERYFSYLLRFRQERDDTPWRVDLEDAHSGERVAFASVESAFAFLKARLQAPTVRSGGALPRRDQDPTS